MTDITEQDGPAPLASTPPVSLHDHTGTGTGIGIGTDAGAAPRRLTGRMSARSLALTVLAFSAPIAVVTGFIPYTILFDGQGAPFAFVVTTVLMLLFSVGYVTMTRHVPKPGDFYSFISTGLGKALGLGSAFLAMLSYIAILAGTYAFLGVSVAGLIASFGGPSTPWWLWTAIGWVIVSTLGYFHIELSAKILSWAMVAEVLIVLIFDVAVLIKGGAQGLSGVPFTPTAFVHGDVPVTILFAVLVFLGFEATALFRDEVRNPNTTIPRATFGAVIFVGVLYILSAYAMISAYGSKATSTATNSPATMFPDAIGSFVAPVFTQIAFVFVVTSLVAALISVHNVLSRYVHNLGNDSALPTYVAKVHDRHGSPHRASNTVAVIAGLGLLPFALTGADASTLYAALTGLGSLGVLFLMTLVSLAVIVWFGRRGLPAGANAFTVFIAPGIAVIALAWTVVFAVLHFDLIVGGKPGQNIYLAVLLAVVFVGGIALALFFRIGRPHVYDRLGRADRVIDLGADR